MDLFSQSEPISVHLRENNAESQQHLNQNRKHFSMQCNKLISLLMEGKRLTVYSALVEHGISSLPRRVLDCTQAGIQITAMPMLGTRIKEYYCDEAQITANKIFLKNSCTE